MTKREFRYPDYASTQGLLTEPSPLQRAETRWMHWLAKHTGLFTPWVYAVASLVLLWFARRERVAAALLLSGLGIELTLLPLVHARDYRYSHWMVVTTILATIILVARRSRAARPVPGAVDTRAA